jgi:hypothetical protein
MPFLTARQATEIFALSGFVAVRLFLLIAQVFRHEGVAL